MMQTRIIVVDAERRLLRASAAGLRILDQEIVLRVCMDRLRAIAQIDDARLERAVAQAAAGGLLEHSLQLGHRGAGVSVSIVGLQGTDGMSEVMLLIRDVREDRRGTLARAAAFFGFTHAEVRLVSALSEGCSVPDAAGRLGVAPTTARTHLQSVFAKTGVRRQVDLLTLLASSGPSVATSAAFSLP